MKTISALVTFIVLTSTFAYAQARHLWTFEELTSKADCVLIGEVVDTLEKGRTTHPELKPAYPAVEFDTTLTVQTVLKPCEGSAVGVTIHLKHYALDFAQISQDVTSLGSLLSFSTRNTYLLFLKRTTAAYEPVSGHTWPTMSVYQLVTPSER